MGVIELEFDKCGWARVKQTASSTALFQRVFGDALALPKPQDAVMVMRVSIKKVAETAETHCLRCRNVLVMAPRAWVDIMGISRS